MKKEVIIMRKILSANEIFIKTMQSKKELEKQSILELAYEISEEIKEKSAKGEFNINYIITHNNDLMVNKSVLNSVIEILRKAGYKCELFSVPPSPYHYPTGIKVNWDMRKENK
jgi:transcription initiation factor TFIIIB Brf1 subunit/transcription initiation factor TFIIB